MEEIDQYMHENVTSGSKTCIGLLSNAHQCIPSVFFQMPISCGSLIPLSYRRFKQ
jgi:hypothetical protein